jgi:SAM-dependent methyltransferase
MWVFEWTGEEFLPAIKDASIVYQHLHRYLYATELLKGKCILDLGAGDGFGSAILAETASSVIAVVGDERLASHATEKYKKSNLQFVTGSVTDGGFDAVVHFDRPLADGVKRFLKPGGLLILSAPYGDDLTCEQLRERLSGEFATIRILGQGVYASSSIWPVIPSKVENLSEVVMSRGGADVFHRVSSDQRRPSFLIAVASDSVAAIQEVSSIFVDDGNELLHEKDRTIQELVDGKAYHAKAVQAFEAQLAERRESLASLQEAFAWYESRIESMTKTREFLEGEIKHYRNTIASNEEGFAWRASQVDAFEKTVARLQEDLAWYVSKVQELEQEVNRLQVLAYELEGIKNSTGWKFVLRVRSLRGRVFPAGSFRYRFYQGAMTFLRRLR